MRTRHQEVIDRIEHMYKDVDGNINFPNSFDGDVLKIAYKSAKASLIQLNNNQKIVLEWLKEHLNKVSDPLGVICGMQKFGLQYEKIFNATFPMNDQEQFEILLAFAQWGLEYERK